MRNVKVHKLQYIIIGLLLSIYYAPSSFACSCVPFDVSKNYEKALFVFEAFMTKTELINDFNGKVEPWGSSSSFVIGNFVVSKTWKGNPDILNGVITHNESSACGLTLSASRSYIHFIYEIATNKGLIYDRDYGVVSLCGGPYSGDRDLLESIRKWLENK